MKSDQSLGYLTRYAHRAFVKALAIELAPHGVSTAEWAVFRVLWDKEGYSQVELARRMRVEKASLTGVLGAMERRRMLLRKRHARDQRQIILTLTAKGRKLRRALVACAVNVNRRATTGLDKTQIGRLRTALIQLTSNLEAGKGHSLRGSRTASAASGADRTLD